MHYGEVIPQAESYLRLSDPLEKGDLLQRAANAIYVTESLFFSWLRALGGLHFREDDE
ncbi:hypothetical protein VB10N_05970 [Vibrio sp. 10N]|nr:hypothetical protein VB10N_05970 [Vibrio sp. 10N]